jgi:hypothetical protein
MSERVTDFEGSYLLGEADGEIWAAEAHPNDAQGLAMLGPDEVGQRDVFGHHAAGWLVERADGYARRDGAFDTYSYYEGFLTAARRARQARAFATASRRL